MSSCRILDDKDLEEQAVKLSKANLRQWLPETLGETRVFERGFIKPFPKAFQTKGTEEPPSTTNFLQRIRGLISSVSTSSKHEPTTPPYGELEVKISE